MIVQRIIEKALKAIINLTVLGGRALWKMLSDCGAFALWIVLFVLQLSGNIRIPYVKLPIKKILKVAIVLILIAGATPVIGKWWVGRSAHNRMFDDVEAVPKCRVALVLGCQVLPNGKLCRLLSDRVDAAVSLYKAGKVEKLLMSGDNRFEYYDEPTRMAEYAVEHGVDPDDVVMDFAGRRTYDSIYRAKQIFGLDELIVVSQGFHVKRALFICDKLGVKAYGMTADKYENAGGDVSRVKKREYLACMAAILDVYILHPKPILGPRENI